MAKKPINKVRLQQELEAIQQVLKERAAERKLERYQPHEKQRQFHASKAKTRLVEGGNRSGKSTCGIAEDLAHAMGYRPWDKTQTIQAPNKGIILAPDFANSHIKTTIPKLKEMAPPSFFTKILKGQHGVEHEFHCANGSVMFLGSYDQKLMKHESADWDWVHFDEPPPRQVRVAVKRGLIDRDGREWFTMTPLTEPWIHDEIHTQAEFDPEIECWCMSIFENPHLSERAIKEFEKDLTEEERSARLFGQYMHLSGVVYKQFHPDVHVIKGVPDDWPNMMPPPHWPRGRVVDPHDRKPFAIAWFVVTPGNDIIFYDEWPNEPFHKLKDCDYDIPKYVQLLKNREELHNADYFWWSIMDPNYGNQINVRTRMTIAEEFAAKGYPFDTMVDDNLERGHLAVKNALRYNKEKPIGHTNKPKVYILDRCSNLIFGMKHYQWKEPTGIIQNYGLIEKPSDKYKDFPDLIRYTVMYEPQFGAPSGGVVYCPTPEEMTRGYK